MQIPSEYLYGLAGAAIALAVARFRGWLILPLFDGERESRRPQTPEPVQVKYVPYVTPEPPEPSQSYSAVIDIPHKITVTPQQGSK